MSDSSLRSSRVSDRSDHKTSEPIISLGGGASIIIHTHPTHAFHFEVTFYPRHPMLVQLMSQRKPPMHFHPHQEEYVRVLEGQLAVDIEGSEVILRPKDEELCVRPWVNHRLYPVMPSNETRDHHDNEVCRFLLSGERTTETFRLDELFFRNWYEYQETVLLGKNSINLLQVMSMFDAGGSYLSLPWWIPFSRSLAMAMGVILGRWVGGLLGYQPFYKKWSQDWDLACTKMRSSRLQRKFAVNNK